MAAELQFFDGFEGGHAWAWDRTGMVSPISGVKYDPEGVFDDEYRLYLDDGDFVGHAISLTGTEVFYGSFWFSPHQIVANQWLCSWYNGSTAIARLGIDSATGFVKLYQGESNAFTHPSTGYGEYALTLDGVFKVSMKIVFDTVLNDITADVYVDGIHVFHGVDRDRTFLKPTLFRLGGTGAVRVSFDNVHIGTIELDTRGCYYVSRRKPNANGYLNEWTPTADPNYDRVNNVPPGIGPGSPHVRTNEVGEIDLYEVEDFLRNKSYLGTWIQAQACFQAEGTPTPEHVQLGYRLNGANNWSSDQVPVIGGCNTACWQVNGVAAGFDEIQVGIKATA